jgi:asparagine synthase (glutamine-hydrolysing)
VADYLVPMLEDKEITFYKDILRLPPAHTLTISREGASLRPYWALDPSREVRLGSDEEYADAFRKIFTDAVHCRLRSAYPVGSMLSGGLDSSSIVCVARQLLSQDENRRLHTFSAIFDDLPQCDERPFINAVLAQGGLEPHFIRADQLSPLADIGRVLGYEDEAFYAPNLFIHWGLYCAAQQQGVRVLLDGLDGDITVSHGIGYLIELASTGRWMTLATYISGLAQNFNRSSWRILYFHVIKPLVPKPIRQAWRALRGWNATDWRLNAIINPKFAQEIGLEERVRTLQGPSNYTLRTSREYHYRGLTHGLIPFALEVADRAGAAFSLEPRYPFFDKRLAEFCLALPGEQKLHRGWSRMIMRRAMADILPAEVQWRGGKADLSPNFVRGLLAPNSQLLEQVILKDSKVLEKYIDTGVLHTAYQRYIAARTEVDALTVWKVASLALWLQHARLTP